MPDIVPNALRITVTRRFAPAATSEQTQQQAFRAFWLPLIPESAPGEADRSMRDLEAQLKQLFPDALKDRIVAARHDLDGIERDGAEAKGAARGTWREWLDRLSPSAARRRPPAAKPDFSFFVTDVRYGSISLALGIAGIRSFIDYFDANFELAWAVLGMYVPEAFAASVTGAEAGDYAATVEVQPDMAAARNPAERGRMQAGDRKWQLVNLTLLLPVILMLGVGWLMLDHFPNTQPIRTEQWSKILDTQADSWAKLSGQQHALIATLIANLPADPAKDCCCAPTPPPPSKPRTRGVAGTCGRAAIAAERSARAAEAALRRADALAHPSAPVPQK